MELSVVLRDVSGKTGKGNLKLRLRKKGKTPPLFQLPIISNPLFLTLIMG